MKFLIAAMAAIFIFAPLPAFANDIYEINKINYLRFGNGQKTLVIIPGLSLQSVMNFASAIKASYKLLEKDFTIYLFDRREDMPDKYSIAEMAEDTAQAIKSLKLDRVCLFGVSQGGMIAMQIAVTHPELVTSMILGSTAARVTPRAQKLFESWVQLAKSGGAAALTLDFSQAVYSEKIFEQYKDLLINAAKAVTSDDLRRFVILTQGMNGFNITEDLAKIQCPVLVIGAKDDKIFGEAEAVEITEQLKSKELFMYDGYGHAVYDFAPDYRERMLNFFNLHYSKNT